MATPRAGLPELMASQEQKEIMHNEALRIVEALCIGGVEAVLNDPPATPTEGAVWIVGTSPTGVWIGKSNQIAHWTNGAWAYYAPAAGWQAYIVGAYPVVYSGVAWERRLWDDSNLAVVGQAEAEAGIATTPRAWTAQRIKQAIVALGAVDPVQESIAAAGTTSATATALTGRQCEVTSCTPASADGVRLPTIVQGSKVVVFNKTGNTLKVYPPTGQQINYAGADVPHSLGAFGTVTYYATKSNSYYT